MKLIKRGTVPQSIWIGHCKTCQAIFEAFRNELGSVHEIEGVKQSLLPCFECHSDHQNGVVFKEKEIQEPGESRLSDPAFFDKLERRCESIFENSRFGFTEVYRSLQYTIQSGFMTSMFFVLFNDSFPRLFLDPAQMRLHLLSVGGVCEIDYILKNIVLD